MAPGDHVYVIKVGRNNSTIGAWIFLTNHEAYPQSRFNEMIEECRHFIDTVRIPKRREETARQKVAIENPPETNDLWFEGDAEVVEAMMIDKFGFRKLMWLGGETKIEPTIKDI